MPFATAIVALHLLVLALACTAGVLAARRIGVRAWIGPILGLVTLRGLVATWSVLLGMTDVRSALLPAVMALAVVVGTAFELRRRSRTPAAPLASIDETDRRSRPELGEHADAA